MPDSLFHLLRLSSASLPVGGFSWSLGLESAVEQGWVRDRTSLEAWLEDILAHGMATLDLPVLIRCQQACAHADMTRVQALDQWLMAWRETAELAAADLEMGANLLRLLQALAPGMMRPEQPLGWVSAWGLAANHWRVALPDSLRGFLWSWVENQLVAASKCMPFGQTDIQRSLIALNGPMSIAIEQAMVIEDEEMGTGLPGLAWLSAAHETQYSRLFRS